MKYCLINEQECFVGFSTAKKKPSGLRPDKTRPASLLKGFKNVQQKVCPSGVWTKD